MDLRNIEISVYNGVLDVNGRRSTLFDFLNNVDYDAIEALRSTADPVRRKAIKLALPQATISGVFAPTRAAENLGQHSGLICIDIDQKDNLHIDNFATLIPDVLSHFEEVLFAAHSVSGQGYFVIIPLRYPHRHKEHFAALARQFDELGINIDRACADVCRLRCQSYDLHQYINLNARPYADTYRQPQPRPIHIDNSDERVAQLCRDIAARGIDLTAAYDDWIRIGMALTTLGESGRQYFHLLSAQNPHYNPTECDRKYTHLLRTPHRITLATLFHLARRRLYCGSKRVNT